MIWTALTMAEFLIHRRSGKGFPANKAQGRVSCCPSITLVTEGLIPMRGATKSERAQALSSLFHPKRRPTPLQANMTTISAIHKKSVFRNKILKCRWVRIGKQR